MDYMALFTHIQKGKPGSLYLLHGPEEFTKGEALNQMIEQWIPQQVRDLNYQVIDGTETTADTIIAACETLPFLSDRRMVVVKDYTGLTGQRSEDEDILKKYLANVSSSTSLVFYVRGNAEKRMIYKAIAKYGEAVEFVRLKHRSDQMGTKRFKINKKISNPDLEHFILQGQQSGGYENETKSFAYAGNSSEVTEQIRQTGCTLSGIYGFSVY